MDSPGKAAEDRTVKDVAAPREPRGSSGATVAARERSMSERLELALSWNAVAAELRAGLANVTASSPDQR